MAAEMAVESPNSTAEPEMIDETAVVDETATVYPTLQDKKVSWSKLTRVDSLNLEAGRISMRSHPSKINWPRTLSLAFQSIGVVYGDIGTSPLYVYASTFGDRINHPNDILGVLSMIIYTIALIPILKYSFIVLLANDNGDGGTFALYSLICRHIKVSLIPNNQPEDRELSNYKLETPSSQLTRSQKIKEKLQESKFAKMMLFLVTIMGTSMTIGDGVLTPCISVLSAVGGIKGLHQDVIVGISIAILVILFSVQRFGTDKVGIGFAPLILVWFALIGGIGVFNLFKHNVGVLRAFNPMYIVDYFNRNGKQAWTSLGGVFLCVTGTEAMFADLGHFSVQAIQISFTSITFPALVAVYSGQAAYLTKFPNNVSDTFYSSIPDPLYWPTFVAAVAASVIASQALISGAFSIVSQSLTLWCFPRVKVVHTSAEYEGQVYIPEINYILMICCVIVTAGFKTTEKIGHAYGIAVVTVMLITTCMVTLIMLVIWKTNVWLIVLFFLAFGSIEFLYFSAVMTKFIEGGYLPLAFSAFLMAVMMIWHYVQKRRYVFEFKNKVSSEFIRSLSKNEAVSRIPGIGFLYSELVQGIPPILPHLIKNVPSVHSVLVIVSIKNFPISKVMPEERFLFRQVEPRDFRIFRCVVRYGYNDTIPESTEFEPQLIGSLKEFIYQEHFITEGCISGRIENPNPNPNLIEEPQLNNMTRVSSASVQSFSGINSANSSTRAVLSAAPIQGPNEEMQFVQKAMENSVVYLLGEAEVVAEKNSSFFKKIIVNYAYDFLRKNFRQGEKVMAIPQGKLLRVGMTYEI